MPDMKKDYDKVDEELKKRKAELDKRDEIVFDREKILLIEHACSMSRDMQFVHCSRLQELMKHTPEKISSERYRELLEQNVKEWDRQITYAYILANIADDLEKLRWRGMKLKGVRE